MNKTVLVTGSSRGIGKAIAEKFGQAGFNIVLNSYNNPEELDNTFNEFSSKGIICKSYRCDVSDYNDCRNMFEGIYDTFGGLDVLINNAGVSHVGLFTQTPPDEWERVIKTNFNSVLNCTHLALPEMIKNKNGCIVNISSIWGVAGSSCEALYSATKGAVNSFTKSMAREVGPCNIRVNAISCGVMDTQMNSWLTEEDAGALKENIPLMRFGRADEVAELAYYLAHSSSSYLTGQIVTLDGGYI